jgi:hypothetical protein
VLRLHSSVSYSNSQRWEFDEVTVHLNCHNELVGGGGRSYMETCRKLTLYSGVNL